jgi:hypothetical protein
VTTKYLRDNSTLLVPSFAPWLQSRGFVPTVITEDDYGTAGGQQRAVNIRSWLVAHQHTHQIRYVLLVGNPDPDDPSAADVFGDIPMMMCWPQGLPPSGIGVPTDHFYADFTGSWDLNGNGYYGEYGADGTEMGMGVDFGPEAYVGRLPVYFNSTSELDALLTRAMQYPGTNPSVLLPMAISNYAGEVMQGGAAYGPRTDGLAMPQGIITSVASPAGYTDYVLYERAGLQAVPTTAYGYDAPLSNAAVLSAWAADHGVALWWGHGYSRGATRKAWMTDDGDTVPEVAEIAISSFITSSDFNAMQQAAHTFAFMCACFNGQPEDTNHLSFAALFTGAMTTVGSTRLSYYAQGTYQYTGARTNADLGYKYVDELIASGSSAGQALFDAKTSLADLYSWNAFSWQNLMDFNLYGDPSLSLAPPLQPASLSATMAAQPGSVPSGGQIAVQMKVTNSGGATATSVAPSMLSITATGSANAVILSAPAAPVQLGPGQSHTFSWSLLAHGGQSGGTLRFSASVSGKDAATAATLSSQASSPSVLVLAQGGLAATITTRLAGSSCHVGVTVTNIGASTIVGVSPALSASSTGTVSAVVSSMPPSGTVSLAPGSSAAYSWTFRIHYPGGTLRFSASATGTDSATSATVTSKPASAEVAVPARAALSLVIQVSGQEVPVNGTVTVTAVISNTGFALASNVSLSPWYAAGQGGVQKVSGPIPPYFDVLAGKSVTVVYTYRATAPGTVVFKGVATGTDIGASAAVYSPEASSAALTVTESSAYTLLYADLLSALADATACAASFHACGIGAAHGSALDAISAEMTGATSFDNPLVTLGQLIEALDLMDSLGAAAGCPCS